jgi:hypothetical protein
MRALSQLMEGRGMDPDVVYVYWVHDGKTLMQFVLEPAVLGAELTPTFFKYCT